MKHFSAAVLAVSLLTAVAPGCDKPATPVKTPSGYDLINHTGGKGPKPSPGDYASVHIYVLQDDSLINSTRMTGRGTYTLEVPNLDSLSPEQKVPGIADPVADAVSMMTVGDSATVLLPITEEMKQFPELQNVKKLAYDIVLVEVKTPDAYLQEQSAREAAAAEQRQAVSVRAPEVDAMMQALAGQYAAGELDGKIRTTDSGLKYMVMEEGTGKQAVSGKPVKVLYYGMLTNGKKFDDSFERGTPIPFTLGIGQVIQGWDEGIALLKEGDKAVLFIPSDLGYGETGAGADIPPNAELVFYVELVAVGE